MPTLSKAQLIETQSPWGAAFDRMYLELCRDRVRILSALGFFAERNLPTPEENSALFRRQTKKRNYVK